MNSKITYNVVVVISPGIAAPYIMMDFQWGFEKLGHKVYTIDLRKFDQLGSNQEKIDFFLKIKDDLDRFMPDFAAGYNTSVLINLPPEYGRSNFFENLKIPYVSLFFDNPMLPGYMREIKKCTSELYKIFIWDRYYLGKFREETGRKAFYLPLAANTDTFCPSGPNSKYMADLSFIGSVSDIEKFDENREKDQWHPWLIQFANDIIKAMEKNPAIPLVEIISAFEESFNESTRNEFDTFKKKDAFNVFMLSLYNQIGRDLRMGTIKNLNGIKAKVYGGESWNKLKNKGIRFMGKARYPVETGIVYNSSKINLNITSAQLVTAVNQRVFDICACKGFLLTDFREDLGHLYDNEGEIVVYKDLNDMKKKVEYYLDHEDERMKVAERGRKRVLSEHTYKHRAQLIIDRLQNRME